MKHRDAAGWWHNNATFPRSKPFLRARHFSCWPVAVSPPHILILFLNLQYMHFWRKHFFFKLVKTICSFLLANVDQLQSVLLAYSSPSYISTVHTSSGDKNIHFFMYFSIVIFSLLGLPILPLLVFTVHFLVSSDSDPVKKEQLENVIIFYGCILKSWKVKSNSKTNRSENISSPINIVRRLKMLHSFTFVSCFHFKQQEWRLGCQTIFLSNSAISAP